VDASAITLASVTSPRFGSVSALAKIDIPINIRSFFMLTY
jgi:hypothetical protein